MMKYIGLVIFLMPCFVLAAPVEVDHLIKCEDGKSLVGTVDKLNSGFLRGEVFSTVEGTESSGPQAIVVKEPFIVSSPAVLVGYDGKIRACVTVSKAKK